MIELLADQLEISRLLEMKVLVRKEEYSRDVLGSLTTKFVRDWRAKLYVDDGPILECGGCEEAAL